jgi:hypothetical protein
VGPMPKESLNGKLYGLILVDKYSRANWVLPLGRKSDAPIEFKIWVDQIQNGTGRNIRTVMFDNAKDFVTGKMRKICDSQGIRINLYQSSNGVAERLADVATSGTRAMLHDAALPPCFWAEAMTTYMYPQDRTLTMANNGKTPFELFYNMRPNVSHICPFGCLTKATLPVEKLGKLDNRAILGYLVNRRHIEPDGWRWGGRRGSSRLQRSRRWC